MMTFFKINMYMMSNLNTLFQVCNSLSLIPFKTHPNLDIRSGNIITHLCTITPLIC